MKDKRRKNSSFIMQEEAKQAENDNEASDCESYAKITFEET